MYFFKNIIRVGKPTHHCGQGKNLNILKNLTDNARIDVKNNGVKEYKVHWVGDLVLENVVMV